MKDEAPREQRAVSGPKVLLITLGACLLGPLVAVWLALKWAQPSVGEVPPLVWADRATWHVLPVKRAVLHRDGPAPPFEGRARKSLEFVLDADEEAWIQSWSGQAQSSDPVGPMGKSSHFYASFLAGRYDESFALAPKVIKWTFVDAAGQPMRGFTIGSIRSACARMSDGVLDDSLRLVFPRLVTDERGDIYLPVYDTVYAIIALPQPDGYQIMCKLPPWFEFPGRVGTLPPAVVHRATE